MCVWYIGTVSPTTSVRRRIQSKMIPALHGEHWSGPDFTLCFPETDRQPSGVPTTTQPNIGKKRPSPTTVFRPGSALHSGCEERHCLTRACCSGRALEGAEYNEGGEFYDFIWPCERCGCLGRSDSDAAIESHTISLPILRLWTWSNKDCLTYSCCHSETSGGGRAPSYIHPRPTT